MNTGKKLKKINKDIVVFLQALDKLHVTIFDCIIHRDFISHPEQYAKPLIHQTSAIMKIMQTLRAQYTNQEKIICRLECLYEIMFSLDLLKYRLFDHATFEVCEPELKSITVSISEKIKEITALIKK